jgi:predicted RNase H-like HicB family nuclease
MEMYAHPITVEREGRKYWTYSEDFPGAYGLGNSLEEAKASILELMRLRIEDCRPSHRPIPRARTVYTETVPLAVWVAYRYIARISFS